jgi:hypothetical protein
MSASQLDQDPPLTDQIKSTLKTESIEHVMNNPIRTEVQANGRIRRWAFIPEAGKYLRVITEPDGETVHNAFFDRRFQP